MRRALPFTALAVLALLACQRSVQGSLSTLMDMTYDTVEVVTGGSDVTVSYTRPVDQEDPAAGTNLVLKVSARGVLPFKADAGTPLVIDLAEQTSFGQRGALARNVQNDPRTTFPEILRGRMVLQNLPVAEQPLSGDFSVTFVLGQEFGDGRTLYDSFQGKVRAQ